MKKMFVLFFMVLGMVMNLQAQEIIGYSAGNIYLANGAIVDASRIPNAYMLRVGEDINYGIQRAAIQEAQRRRIEAARDAYTDMYAMAANAAVYGGACYGGAVAPVVIGGGYESRGISVGNEHWGFSTNSSKCGAYESGSTNIRVGGFHIGTYKSGMSKATKKAAASNMKNNSVATSASTRSTSNNGVKEVNIRDLMRYCK